MTTIYERDHRSFEWQWLFLLAGPALVGYGILELMRAVPEGSALVGIGVAITIAPVCVLGRSPSDIRIGDEGEVLVRATSGSYTYFPAQLKAISYSRHWGTSGILSLRTDGRTWYLPCKKRQAEDIVAALHQLNPSLRIVWSQYDGP